MFRYAIDAAAMDWIGNGDHDNGAGREYSWWLIQKFTDAYHVPGSLHADVHLRAQRGLSARPSQLHVRPARRPHVAAPGRAGREKRVGGVHADDTKMLYRYLKELDGICASHTSATGMGTDWRDNDPEVEPIVEIYQGDRMSYEIRGGAARRLRSQGRQEAGQHRRLVSPGASSTTPCRQGLSPRLRVVQRSLVHAHFLLHRPGREARPRRASSTR